MVLAGVPLPMAIGALLPNVLVQTSFSSWQHRSQLPWHDAVQMLLIRAAGLPLGILTLKTITDAGQELTRQIVGASLVGLLLLQHVSPGWLPSFRSGRWQVAAGVASGFLAGLVGMGGPPLVLWLMGQDWPAARQRSFLWLSFLLLSPLQIVILWLTFGAMVARALAAGVAIVPLVVAVAWLGGLWGNSLSKERLRWLMRGFLLLLGLRLVLGPWISA